MAVDVIALMGNVTKSHTARLLGMDFTGWKLRKDDPGTPGSTIRGADRRKRDNFVLVCASLADLERAGQLLTHEGQTNRLVVVVDETSRPELVNLMLGRLPSECEFTLRSHKRGFVFSAVSETWSLDIGEVVKSLVVPAKKLGGAERVAVQDASMAALVEPSRKPGIGLASVSREPDSVPPFDVFLAHTDGAAVASLAREDVAMLTELGISVIDVDAAEVHPVDVRWASPVGFNAEPTKGIVDLTLEKVKHRVLLTASGSDTRSRVYDVGAGLNENLIADLRPFRRARLLQPAVADRGAQARVLAGLACAGVPVDVEDLSGEPSGGLGEQLRARYSLLADVELGDNLERQIWSVETRRLALQEHSHARVWDRIVPAFDGQIPATESVSVLVPSRRPEFVGSIVRQIVHQTHANREVLVGLHGYTAEELFIAEPWLRSIPGVSFVEMDTRFNLGQVLSRLTAKASGDFVAKMDDDDLYTVHHLEDLLAASRYAGADLVGCKAEFVYLEGSDMTVQRRPNSEVHSRYVTGGTMLLSRSTLKDVGGWSEVGTAEDRLLQEAITKLGGRVYRSHGLNYLMRRGDGTRIHTWNPGRSIFEKQAIRQWTGLGYPGWRTSGHE